LLPPQYPLGVIRTHRTGPLAAIDLFIQIFYLIQKIGLLSHIDPGKPQVPEFGRKMYHTGLPLSSVWKKSCRDVWITRKGNVSNHPISSLEQALSKFLNQFKNKFFSGVIFDYDGTLCDSAERFTCPKPEVAAAINKLLSCGILIGIATGRGRSVQRSLLKVIDQNLWSRVIVGNYNGALITNLTNPCPEFDENTSPAIQDAYRVIQEDSYLCKEIETEFRSQQISVTSKGHISGQILFNRISDLFSPMKNIKILQSSHSIDILDTDVSKVYVVEALKNMLPSSSQDILIVGDQGQPNGNDFDLLNRPYSLSVDKVSPSLSHCWNLSPAGRRGANATLSLIKAMHIENGMLYLNINHLEQETG
jgi:HAD superfamily hydrolase (TIGR01484 family)